MKREFISKTKFLSNCIEENVLNKCSDKHNIEFDPLSLKTNTNFNIPDVSDKVCTLNIPYLFTTIQVNE